MKEPPEEKPAAFRDDLRGNWLAAAAAEAKGDGVHIRPEWVPHQCVSSVSSISREGLWPGGRHTFTVMSPLPVRGGLRGVSRQENTQISKSV